MPWDERTGLFFPLKRSDVYCHFCRRPFAKGTVPTPNEDGLRSCRDCRHNH